MLAQPGVVDRHHRGVVGEGDRERAGGLVLLAGPDAERADAPQGVERIERRRRRAVQHGVRPDLAEQVGLTRDHAERGVVVAGDALRGRVQGDVDAVVERALAERRGERRVDERERSLDRAEFVEVGEFEARVRRGLGEHEHRAARLDGGGERAGFGDVDVRDIDPEPLARALEERQRAGVQLALGDDVAAARTQREHRRGERPHARGEGQCVLGAFEFGDRALERTHRGVGVAAVEVAVADRRGAAVGVVEALRLPRARCPQGGGERGAARAPAGGDRRCLGCDIGSVHGIVVRHAAHGTGRAASPTRRFRPSNGLRQTLRPPHSKVAATDSRSRFCGSRNDRDGHGVCHKPSSGAVGRCGGSMGAVRGAARRGPRRGGVRSS